MKLQVEVSNNTNNVVWSTTGPTVFNTKTFPPFFHFLCLVGNEGGVHGMQGNRGCSSVIDVTGRILAQGPPTSFAGGTKYRFEPAPISWARGSVYFAPQ